MGDPLLNDEGAWTVKANCIGEDTSVFFPGPEDDPKVAIKICNRCVVRDDCLDWAVAAKERFGIWGATTERQRRRIIRRSA